MSINRKITSLFSWERAPYKNYPEEFDFSREVELKAPSEVLERRKGGRGAVGKIPAFKILKREDRISTVSIENAKDEMLLFIIKIKYNKTALINS